MRLGLVLPQGFAGEFAGWPPERAWTRMLAVARLAEDLGVESVWVFDHVGTFGTVRDEPTFEAFAVLGALATATSRVRIGPLVARAGLRNPALLAKQVASLDVISGGRLELGLGAAAPRDETLSFGYPLLPFRDRVTQLRETLAIVRPLLTTGRASFQGEHAHAADGVLNPRGAGGHRIPLLVGGNTAPTWRVAAEFADEINLDGTTPAALPQAQRGIAEACGHVGRDPSTLALSVHVLPGDVAVPGRDRASLLAQYVEAGVNRVMALLPNSAEDDAVITQFIADARDAGVRLA